MTSENKLDQPSIDLLKNSWANLYSNNAENVIVLNKGLEFKEASNTSVEMQLNENKTTNSEEICKLFNFILSVVSGKATESEYISTFKTGIMPLLKENANKDLRKRKRKIESIILPLMSRKY